MDVRSQIAMVFHLDKCIGCHTCSVACKNVWTDRQGTEYMWWNNVETKPGTGYPTRWEDQEKYSGGWEKKNEQINLKSTGKGRVVFNIFHNPQMPSIDDYYEPWTYDYQNLFNAPEGSDQPTAIPLSVITNEPIDIESGPNWDDDLGGSPVYAENDPNLEGLTDEQKQQLSAIERLVLFYFPRICNHCLNPSCVASCPSGALYKRGEDGVVLIDQQRCRGWRSCVSACPYKKTFFNWFTGKSEKCILCFPRIETGQAPACFHSCVGRIRYLGVLLYDAEKIEEVGNSPQEELIDAQRSMILDPHDPEVIAAARRNGISDSVIESAQQSPVYKFVKVWKIALPPHIEFRTLPMLFYVPPLSPVMSQQQGETVDHISNNLFHEIDDARVPLKFLANLFGAGHEGKVRYALGKQKAVRIYRRAVTVGDITMEQAENALREANSSPQEAEAIYKLTSLCTFNDRFVIPPSHREEAIQMMEDPRERQRSVGFGISLGSSKGTVTMTTTDATWDLLGKLLAYPKSDYQQLVQRCLHEVTEPKNTAEQLRAFAESINGFTTEKLEEKFTQTFDLNPVCCLEVGWHLYGENYNRGEFMVRAREELREHQIPETAELPDHLTHLLPLLSRMESKEASIWITEYILPTMDKMLGSLEGKDSVFENLLKALRATLIDCKETD